jgi:hypothetical protein
MARVIFLLTVYYNGEVLEMNQSETRIACEAVAAMFVDGSG